MALAASTRAAGPPHEASCSNYGSVMSSIFGFADRAAIFQSSTNCTSCSRVGGEWPLRTKRRFAIKVLIQWNSLAARVDSEQSVRHGALRLAPRRPNGARVRLLALELCLQRFLARTYHTFTFFHSVVANQSSISAFLTNRVGDCFLTIGMFAIL